MAYINYWSGEGDGGGAHLEERADVEQRAVSTERYYQIHAVRERLACMEITPVRTT